MLIARLNDADAAHAEALRDAIAHLIGIEKLKHKPQITCGEIDQHAEQYFNEIRLIPSFTFVDPFGYSQVCWASR